MEKSDYPKVHMLYAYGPTKNEMGVRYLGFTDMNEFRVVENHENDAGVFLLNNPHASKRMSIETVFEFSELPDEITDVLFQLVSRASAMVLPKGSNRTVIFEQVTDVVHSMDPSSGEPVLIATGIIPEGNFANFNLPKIKTEDGRLLIRMRAATPAPINGEEVYIKHYIVGAGPRSYAPRPEFWFSEVIDDPLDEQRVLKALDMSSQFGYLTYDQAYDILLYLGY